MTAQPSPERWRSILAIGLTLGLLAAACSGSDGSGEEVSSGTDTADSTDPTDPADATDSADSTAAPTTAAAPDTTGTSETTTSTAPEPAEDTTGSGGEPQPANCETRPEGDQRFTTDAGGPETSVQVYVPAGAGAEPLPVVLNWHGLGSNGTQQALLSAYEGLADDEGFLVVHPTGAGNSWELAQFDVAGRDDIAMVDDVIDRLISDFCADPSRVYSTGMSNGGFFTALLVCERADRIAAATSVAGVSHPDGCEPSRPVPFIAFHGTDDDVVAFAGGESTLRGGRSDPVSTAFFAQSMPEEFAEFATDFGCQPDPEPTTIGDEVTRNDYVGCDDGVPLSFYVIDDGGHTWPGSPVGPLLTGALGRTTNEVSATEDGWAFMSQFSLPPDQ